MVAVVGASLAQRHAVSLRLIGRRGEHKEERREQRERHIRIVSQGRTRDEA